MAKKRILFVELTQDGTIGGSHYCLLYLIRGLDRSKYEPVTVFYEDSPLVDEFRHEGETIVMNTVKYYSKGGFIIRKPINFVLLLGFILTCYRFIRKNNIDLVHLNNSIGVGYDTWLIASRLAKIPCITHDRSFSAYPVNKLFFRLLFKRYDRVLAVSNVIRDNILKYGFDPRFVVTVYDGIDADSYRKRVTKTKEEIFKEFNMSHKTPLLGLVGNVRQWKGQEYLIDALKIVHDNLIDFKCLLIGSVATNTDADVLFKDRLIEKIDKYGLGEKIIFTGYRPDVPDLINALDIQINASIKPDPFPHVILEGLSLGNVIIATNLGGARESIEDGVSGFLISHNNPKEFAERIMNVLSNNDVSNKIQAGATNRIPLFSIEKNVHYTELIYDELL